MSSFRYVDRAASAWARPLLAPLLLCAALYAVLLVGGAEALGLGVDPDSWWPVGVLSVCAGGFCAARAVLQRRERLAGALLGVGITSSGCGFILWALLYEHQASPPYPSLADALWIPYFGLLLAASPCSRGRSASTSTCAAGWRASCLPR
jgi:hypothetical protein